MASFLGVGIAAVDIVNVVEFYPNEDDEVRAVAQSKIRGGNVTNTACVLAQFDHDVYWAGTSSHDPDAEIIFADLAKYGINTSNVRRYNLGKVPTSYITLSRANGSRTIVHYRDLPEYCFDDFALVRVKEFDWIHFEGRAIDDTREMLRLASAQAPNAMISLEVEKPRPNIESLIPFAKLIFFSRQYAIRKGFTDAVSFLQWVAKMNSTADLVCAWGETGAFGLDGHAGAVFHAPAYRPAAVVDTIGAGDTLIAGVIHGLMSGKRFFDAVHLGVRLAGLKCGQSGYDNLARQVQT